MKIDLKPGLRLERKRKKKVINNNFDPLGT
jgi:hypothetical protein